MNVKSLIKATLIIFALSFFVADTADAQRGSRGGSQQKKEQLYPDAVRKDPTIKQSPRMQRQVAALIKAHEADNFEQVIVDGQKVIEAKAAGAYERALAWQLIGVAKTELDDYAGAIEAFQNAYDADGLDNNGHYNMLMQIAQLQYQEERPTEALATIDRFLQESGKQDPQMLALKGGLLYEQDRFTESAQAIEQAVANSDKPNQQWLQMLMMAYISSDNFAKATELGERLMAENPDDQRMLFNVATMYAQADNNEKATEVLEQGRARNMLDDRGYRQLYALYMNMDDRERQAIEVIKDGLAKDIIKPSAEAYTVLAQAYYFSDDIDGAIDAYQKALPYAEDGEAALNLARLLSNEERYQESRKLAREALDKGLRRPGEAHIIIGRAEYGLGNPAGLRAAYREAAKYPETKQAAEEWLRRNP